SDPVRYIFLFYQYDDLESNILAKVGVENWVERLTDYKWERRELNRAELKTNQSILSQRNDPESYPVLAYLGKQFRSIRLYNGWGTEHNAPFRQPQNTDLDSEFLAEDASNLALVLNDLRNKPDAKRTIIERLRQFNDKIEDFGVSVFGNAML